MKLTGSILGLIAGLCSIGLWIIFVFQNPYVSNVDLQEQLAKQENIESAFNTIVLLVLPACVAITSSLTRKKYLMLVAFIWSLPISLYMFGTSGIFAWFMATCTTYFISFVLMLIPNNLEVFKNRT